MKKIAIVTDSNSGITPELAKKLGVTVIPMPVIINETEYFEEVNLTQDKFFEYLESGKDVFTSQPSIGSLTSTFNKLLEEYDEIVHIPMSSGLSSSYQTAKIIAEEYDGRVFVVNNQRISITLYHDVLIALELVNRGKSGQEILEYLEDNKFNSSIYITVPTLKYLKKGGRVTAAAAALGSLLKIKPVLTIQGEKLDAFSKVRTISKAKQVMNEALIHDIETRIDPIGKGKNVSIFVAYSRDEKLAKDYVEQLKEVFPEHNIIYHILSTSISTHIGPDCIAIGCALNLD